MNCVKCACGFEHITFESFLALNLPFPKSSTMITHANSLEKCMREYTKKESIQKDDGFFCSHCKSVQECSKRTVIWRFPPALVLQLKRFHVSTWKKEKLDTMVEFPQELDLRDFRGNSGSLSVSVVTPPDRT